MLNSGVRGGREVEKGDGNHTKGYMGVVVNTEDAECQVHTQAATLEKVASQDTCGPCPDRGWPQEGPESDEGFLYHSGTSRHTVALDFRSRRVPLSEFHCASVCPPS